MKNIIQSVILPLLLLSNLVFSSCDNDDNEGELQLVFPEEIVFSQAGLMPEGIEYDRTDNTFLLSSLTQGQIVKVDLESNVLAFTNDTDLFTSVGIHINRNTNELYVAGIDGRVLDPTFQGQGFSALYIYDLATGQKKDQIMLSPLLEPLGYTGKFFANDLTVDDEGNIYIGDWFAGVIYKVDNERNASIFYQQSGDSYIEPNGMDFHPDGYLLVSDLDVGVQVGIANPRLRLIKIPTDNPDLASVVNINGAYFGFDGMLYRNGNIIGVTSGLENGIFLQNQFLLELSSSDDWTTADIVNQTLLKAQSTTVTTTETGTNYVINQDFSNPNAESWTIERVDP